MLKKISLLLVIFIFQATAVAALRVAEIEKNVGAKGNWDPQTQSFKISIPRDDLSVSAQGIKITPAMGLTSWASFKTSVNQVAVTGALALVEDQVNSMIDLLLQNNLQVMALQNHFMWEKPRLMFLHFKGEGDETALAERVGKVFAQLKVRPSETGYAINFDIDPANSRLSGAKIDSVLGAKGQLLDGVYKVAFKNSIAAFAGTDMNAVVEGYLALQEGQLQQVLKKLRAVGINIVGIRQQDSMVFVRYWGTGKIVDLAEGLRV